MPKLEASAKNFRDKLIFHLLASTGIRVSELVALNREDISPNLRQITLKRKNGLLQLLISEITSIYLEHYLTSRNDQYPALFISFSKKSTYLNPLQPRLTPRSVQRILKNLAQKSKTTPITPSQIRNDYAFSMFKNGTNQYKIQTLLGHMNKGSTRNLKRLLFSK